MATIEQWFESHVAPDLEKAKADVGKVLDFARAHAANAEAIAGLVVKVIEAADPALAPVIATLLPEAERVLAEAERLAEQFTGKGTQM